MNHVVNPVFQTSNFGWFINPYPSKRQLIEDGNSSHLTGGLSALATHCRTSCSAGVTLKASRNKAMASCGWCFGSSFKDNKMLHPVEFNREPQFLWDSRRWKMTFRLIMAMFWGSMIHFGGNRPNLGWGWSYFGRMSSHLLSLRPLQCPKPSLIAFSTAWILSAFPIHGSQLCCIFPMNWLNP